jgi:hypothetical protein
MIEAILSFFAKAWGYVATYFLASSIAKSKRNKDAIKSHETRQDVEDSNRRMSFDDRRRMLRDKWSVRGVEKNKPD